ncbi:MAG: hypothetical protein V7734_15770, partial [Maribacter arcticus]
IHPREHDLVIGTFGRAAWVLDDIRPLRALASDKTILNKEIALFTPPTAYQAFYQQPTGSRFGGDGLYQGENKKPGAMITYYLKEGKKEAEGKKDGEKEMDSQNDNDEDKEKVDASTSDKPELTGVQKKDSVQFDFYDGQRLIRSLKYKTPEKAGFHRIFWGMDEKGADRPSRKVQTKKNESSGLEVKPGTYTIKMLYGDFVEEAQITVKSDPRLEISTTGINEAYTNGKVLESYMQKSADAVKQLAQSKEVAEQFQKELKKLDEKKFKDQIEASKNIVKQIDSVTALYLGKVDKRQGITRNKEMTVMQRLQIARGYVGSRKTGMTVTEKQLMQFAKDELESAVKKTNTFFSTEWSDYKGKMESLELSPFKETEVFNLN